MEGQSPGEISFDTKQMSQTLMHLEDKILELKKFGEQLAMSMEGAAVSLLLVALIWRHLM